MLSCSAKRSPRVTHVEAKPCSLDMSDAWKVGRVSLILKKVGCVHSSCVSYYRLVLAATRLLMNLTQTALTCLEAGKTFVMPATSTLPLLFPRQ
jgi:hypothetical protein